MILIPNTLDKIDPLPKLGEKWVPPVVMPPAPPVDARVQVHVDCMTARDMDAVINKHHMSKIKCIRLNRSFCTFVLSMEAVKRAFEEFQRIFDEIKDSNGWKVDPPIEEGIYIASTLHNTHSMRYWNGKNWSRFSTVHSQPQDALHCFKLNMNEKGVNWLVRLA
jgi:hypothetical protein